jgi:hypothetical protein
VLSHSALDNDAERSHSAAEGYQKEMLMSEKKAPGKLTRALGTKKSAKSTTAIDKTVEGFTDDERVAMNERAQELKAAAEARIRALVKKAVS